MHLQHSKTDPFHEGAELFVARTNNEPCPVAALLSWLVRRGNSIGPLFLFQSSKPLTLSNFVSCLKQALVAAGVDSTRFSATASGLEQLPPQQSVDCQTRPQSNLKDREARFISISD